MASTIPQDLLCQYYFLYCGVDKQNFVIPSKYVLSFFHEECTVYIADDGVIDGTDFLSNRTGTLI